MDHWNRVTLPAMNSYSTLLEMTEALAPAVRLEPELKIVDRAALRDGCLDRLTATAIFARDAALRDAARWVIRAAAAACGIHSASIQDLYAARGRGECTGFTVPAINIRGLTYDTARAVFRAARNLPNIAVATAEQADPVSLIAFEKVIATEDAIRKLEERLA